VAGAAGRRTASCTAASRSRTTAWPPLSGNCEAQTLGIFLK
jgi:hypothetical protein